MRLSDRLRRVVVVGAGLGGTATAVRLLQFAREPLQVMLIERRPEYRSAGVAYHPAGNHWHHVFNIQAGRMSMFREDVDDFVAWANDEADRTGWPPEWSGFTFTESGPAPRRIYAAYLADRLARAAREAADGVTLVEADGEVVDVAVGAGHAHVVVERFSLSPNETSRVTLRADHVVVATGLEERDLPFAAGVADHPSFVRHPYSEAGIARILGTGKDATVAIIGTLLTAYDSATLLLRRGHTGKIAMISRSGRMLRTTRRTTGTACSPCRRRACTARATKAGKACFAASRPNGNGRARSSPANIRKWRR
ncbi:FAD/NAD(P)-binding protein [Amycolatopsis sp., V23-08]|uniref:FAD/NAD(P)-binding protein n=1 Tax=Amycolatopsis heterodermiae TaxID=3110235 RepID=A0ABU5RB71_9PSEU|nr:FAD/NAD(P)-binding protein [Amycolatopsis sp., V23-08]MEA5362496.1 FAD/NAD(P)-binding protein [Amycolatopsis sp., V23-08]